MEKIKNNAKKHTVKTKERVKHFSSELRKTIHTAVLVAFGFLIALVWRDVIQGWVTNISSHSPVQGQLISALIVTVICVLGIIIITRFLGEKKIKKSSKKEGNED